MSDYGSFWGELGIAMHKPAGSKIGRWLRSGYLLFVADKTMHYMAVELDGDGRVEYEGCKYTHNRYLHLPSLVTIYFLYGWDCRLNIPALFTALRSPSGWCSSSHRYLLLCHHYHWLQCLLRKQLQLWTHLLPYQMKWILTTNMLNPTSASSTSYPSNSPIMPMIDWLHLLLFQSTARKKLPLEEPAVVVVMRIVLLRSKVW